MPGETERVVALQDLCFLALRHDVGACTYKGHYSSDGVAYGVEREGELIMVQCAL